MLETEASRLEQLPYHVHHALKRPVEPRPSPQIGGSGYLLAGREQPDLANTIMECLTRPVEQPPLEERRRPVRVQSVRQLAFAM